MKTILFLLLSILPLTARDATFAWDPNPAADQVTGYRLEILNAQGQWVAAGTSTTTTLGGGASPPLSIGGEVMRAVLSSGVG